MCYNHRIFMNFHKYTPFALFAACYFACLFSQLETGRGEIDYQCVGREELPISHLQNEEQARVQVNSKISQQIHKENEEVASPPLTSPSTHLSTSEQLTPTHQTPICTRRQLQSTVQTSNIFIYGCTLIFQPLILITRNLILVGIATNSIQLFLPFLILSESFMMMAFWTCQKHYLINLYTNVFSSYWDIFNAIRLITQPHTTDGNLPQLSQYGFSSIAIFNLSGEFFVALVLLIITILSKISAVCLKYEWLRKVAANLRPIWNSYYFAIFPRVATFTGLHWRLVGVGAGYDVLNGFVCSILSLLIIFYFIVLILQTRRVNEKPELIEQSKGELGLVRRINHKKQFEFDCLKYSSLYYPTMNYFRLFLYFLPIGLSWDFYYASYGGSITAQLMMMMIEVSSTGYILLRDKILFPLQNFMMIMVQLCIITVGLAESVSHSEVSEIAETIMFSLLLFVFGSSLAGVVADAWTEVRSKCQEKDDIEGKRDNETGLNLVHRLAKSGTESLEKKSNDSDYENASSEAQNVQKGFALFKKQSQGLTHTLKIKKVRKGKII